jgi:hypothetical protein
MRWVDVPAPLKHMAVPLDGLEKYWVVKVPDAHPGIVGSVTVFRRRTAGMARQEPSGELVQRYVWERLEL